MSRQSAITYPTPAELDALMASLGGGHISKAALALGLSYAEVNEIQWRGSVHPYTASYWQMVRREAAKQKDRHP